MEHQTSVLSCLEEYCDQLSSKQQKDLEVEGQ